MPGEHCSPWCQPAKTTVPSQLRSHGSSPALTIWAQRVATATGLQAQPRALGPRLAGAATSGAVRAVRKREPQILHNHSHSKCLPCNRAGLIAGRAGAADVGAYIIDHAAGSCADGAGQGIAALQRAGHTSAARVDEFFWNARQCGVVFERETGPVARGRTAGAAALTYGLGIAQWCCHGGGRFSFPRHRYIAPQTRAPANVRAYACPCAATLRSTTSIISAAISAPPKFLTSRMPVGEVTLISVR